MSKRGHSPCSSDEEEYNEDQSTYTKIRLIPQDEGYEVENSFLRRKIAALQDQATSLDQEIEQIINTELDDVISLMDNMQLYFIRYCEVKVELLQLKEAFSELQRNQLNQLTPEKPTEDLVSLKGEIAAFRMEIQDFRVLFKHLSEANDETESKSPASNSKDNTETDTLQATIPCDGKDGDGCQSGKSFLSLLPYPEDVETSSWFHNAFQYLNVSLGEEYLGLVKLWTEYERRHRWDSPSSNRYGLDRTHRPDIVFRWLKNGRDTRPMKEVDQKGYYSPEFNVDVWKWWTSLQPSWRLHTVDGIPAPCEEFGEDWSSLDKYGRNGWVMLLVCLKWWGIGLQLREEERHDEARTSWHALVADMAKMLDGLLQSQAQMPLGQNTPI